MSISPFLAAPLAIQVHAGCAIGALLLGLVQFAAPKGTLPHRTLGWIWTALMAAVVTTSFFIHEIKLWGRWSPIHLIAVLTLFLLPLAVWHAHRHDVRRHRLHMTGLFLGALVITGGFTLLPGRILGAVFFGD